MPAFTLYTVAPKIPEKLAFLETLSNNMWYSWNHDAFDLFRRLDAVKWKASRANPKRLLYELPQLRLEEAAADDSFLEHLSKVKAEFEKNVSSHLKVVPPLSPERHVAYFSLEYGIHESIRLYSGGLGVLAGDHLKSASDMKLPLVGIGLLYRQGYFRQTLDQHGWQHELYPENEIPAMPITRALDKAGHPVTIRLRLLDQDLTIIVWQLMVGTVPLLLLDTEVPENPPALREITWRLYGGEKQLRLHQELALGIGGYRALIAMGYEPRVCHMNEGHAAFLSLARVTHLMETKGLDMDSAIEIVWRSNVFTTHTPVPAGNEVFDLSLLRPYLETLAPELKMDVNRIIGWGQPPVDNKTPHEMSMTVLGLRMAHYSNGVSKLHGEVARGMWKHLWPGRPEDEIPIEHITNGVHVPTWVATPKRQLFARYLGSSWNTIDNQKELEELIDHIPDEALWRAHEMSRSVVIRLARQKMAWQLTMQSATSQEILHAKTFLDRDALTIGFARRFATYKRASLLLSDPHRLKTLLTDPDRPVQFLFAGKAHPADDEGKKLIQELVAFAKREGLQHRLLFLSNYNIRVARAMVQGVDLWLNTPRRPQEASGTSGMKAAVNGVLNCSIMDGWWVEGYESNHQSGWAIPSREDIHDDETRDTMEAQALYNLLENEIVPTFYDRPGGDLPLKWIERMKESIKMSLRRFASDRMVGEYHERFYLKASDAYEKLTADDAKLARELGPAKIRNRALHKSVHVDYPQIEGGLTHMHVGHTFKVTTRIALGELTPEEVDVEVYYGPVDAQNVIIQSNRQPMEIVEDLGGGNYVYKAEIISRQTGRFGLSARVTPAGKTWSNRIPGIITWAS
ncbi:MAG: alpha-glucan family phosphorylase [Lentisphaeria bacterium]|nr:alpha-glucan family phosphorylase [Lentisphaeria bacterium]